MTKQKTAHLVKDVSEHFRGTAQLFKLSHDITFINDKDQKENTPFVVVSKVKSMRTGVEGETYIFPADHQGKVLSWQELPGSTRGQKSAKNVLFELGDFHLDQSRKNN